MFNKTRTYRKLLWGSHHDFDGKQAKQARQVTVSFHSDDPDGEPLKVRFRMDDGIIFHLIKRIEALEAKKKK